MEPTISIPTDVSKFKIRHLFWLVISFSVALASYTFFPQWGKGLILLCSTFWIGMGLLVISDSIDNGPIDERKLNSQIFNVVGIQMVAVSLLGVMGWIAAGIFGRVILFFPISR